MKLSTRVGFVGFLMAASLQALVPMEAGAVVPSSLKQGNVEQRLTALTGAVEAKEGQVEPGTEKLSPKTDSDTLARFRRFRRRFRRRRR